MTVIGFAKNLEIATKRVNEANAKPLEGGILSRVATYKELSSGGYSIVAEVEYTEEFTAAIDGMFKS